MNDARLTDDLLVIARRHPRETWADHASLGATASFWLDRHRMFRQFDQVIREGVEAGLDGKVEPAALRSWLARHAGLFLGQLEEHHHVEDAHYFPLFKRVAPRLDAGFLLLESDHEAIHAALTGLAAAASDVLRAASLDQDVLGRFHQRQVALGRMLGQHLDDEETLVIPLILEVGEAPLFG